MKLSMTNDTTQTSAIIGVYGPPKSGKTFSIATALPLGDVLHISTPGEGNAGSSLRDYPIHQVKLEAYEDLMALEAVLLDKPADWIGDVSDIPQAKLTKPIDPIKIQQLKEFIPKSPVTICTDGIQALQADLFGTQSITHWGKDIGMGKYGDIGELTRIHYQRFTTIPSVKLVIFITQDQQVTDKSLGGQEATYREMEFEGKKSRSLIPKMCDMVLPIFSTSQLGDKCKEWRFELDGLDKDKKPLMRNRYFALVPFAGYWAGMRVGLTTDVVVRADFSYIWNRYYAKKKEAVKK